MNDSTTSEPTRGLSGSTNVIGAPFADRFAAALVDFVILLIPLGVLHFSTIPFFGPLVLSTLYYVFFEASAAQATPGKRLAGIKVIDSREGEISVFSALARMLFRILSQCLLFLPHMILFLSPKRQTAHDLLTDTYVVVGKTDAPLLEAWVQSIKNFLRALEQRFRKQP